MEIQGKIIQLLPEQSGTGKNGQWRKQEYILETQDQYPRKVCFNLWGDKIDQNPVKEGDMVKVLFDIESREFNGRWYTDVKGWKIETQDQGAAPDGPPPIMDEADFAPSQDNSLPEEDDLPF
ncbi:MAG: DUF3127 domain-containing protein [Bacteroidales bacterium]|nr:DUF3127 domain-containing protein [Bacteroidales bacterium]MBN2818148.1 DUF3127 domain-containing protein [Bacteroidales bacterium]